MHLTTLLIGYKYTLIVSSLFFSGFKKSRKIYRLSTIDYRQQVKHTKLMELCMFRLWQIHRMGCICFWNDRFACECV